MLHTLIKIWFEWVEAWGYLGVFILMALESSIIPVPSEIVMPPAAFWASQGRMKLEWVIAAGTFGSYFGSIVSYYISQWIGLPILRRYGKYVFLSEDKLNLATQMIEKYGVMGVFVARQLPVIRHLISIPAGICRMSVFKFSITTLIGAGVWCTVLALYGGHTLGQHPELLQSPEDMIHVMKSELIPFVVAIVIFAALYSTVIYFKLRLNKLQPSLTETAPKK